MTTRNDLPARRRLRGFRLTTSAWLALTVLPASAQYQVHQWANYENGQLPEKCVTIGPNPQQTIEVVKLSEVSGMPANFSGGEAGQEVGEYVLKLTANPKPPDFRTYTTGLAVGEILDRDQLGANGRAIYQADFYLPADGYLPSLAVLAMEPPAQGHQTGNVVNVSKPFYRFGLTKGRQLYFSSFFPGSRNKSKEVFHQDPQLLKQLPRPGWHRFAIVMEGPETIRCYVDGREASFSPFREPLLRKLMVGVMLADNENSYAAYVDNLSIQVSNEAPSIPESPYTEGWTIPPGSTRERRTVAAQQAARPTPRPAPDPRWMEATAAWKRAQQERIPLLLYFYAPGLPGTTRMDEIFATHSSARAFLSRHAAARIDVNQLRGGEAARQYSVYKVPTLIVISPDAQSYRRSTPSREATWEEIEKELRLN